MRPKSRRTCGYSAHTGTTRDAGDIEKNCVLNQDFRDLEIWIFSRFEDLDDWIGFGWIGFWMIGFWMIGFWMIGFWMIGFWMIFGCVN